MNPELIIVLVVIMALIFDFLNGFNDSANIVATIITSNAMKPRNALIMAAIAELIGPFLFGTAVAATIGKGIINPDTININIIFAALGAAIIWNLFTWYFGIPSSSSHALVGGLVGSVLVGYGPSFINSHGLLKVVISLLAAPLLGLVVGFVFMRLILFLARSATPKINRFFKRTQIFTSIALALSHSTNDAQKTMGIITMSLVILKFQQDFVVPAWAIAICAATIGLGTAIGGRRIIKTVGGGIYRIRPVHGFAAQTTSASVILSAALLGGPVSTSQVMNSAIMGVGAAERISKVRWGVVRNILATWLITIPSTALLSGIFYLIISYFFKGLGG